MARFPKRSFSSRSHFRSKKRKLAHLVSKINYRRPVESNADRAHFIIEQSCDAEMIWNYVAQNDNIPTATDGFILSMTAMVNAFQGGGLGVTQGGLPKSLVAPGTLGGLYFQNIGTSGTTEIPDGL